MTDLKGMMDASGSTLLAEQGRPRHPASPESFKISVTGFGLGAQDYYWPI
jgi:hypothetical protein